MFYPLFLRPAEARDIPALEKIFFEADIFLSDNGITEWSEKFPLGGELSALSSAGRLFAITDHRDLPLGCVTFEKSGSALIMKNAVLDRAHRGQGCFSTVIRYAEREAGMSGLTVIAAETGASNFIARQALVRELFRMTEERELPDGRIIVRYERELRRG